MATKKAQPTKRLVTMTSVVALPTGDVATHQAKDYVPDEILDRYVADAQKRWQLVEVGDYEHGPGGEDGKTQVPVHLKRGVSLEDHLAEENG